MTALRSTLADYAEAARAFSRPARIYLFAEFLVWTAQGIFAVLFNLYLVEAGFPESFVGRAISMNALGLAIAALPAGVLAERWGRRRSLLLGAILEGLGHLLRASLTAPGAILASGFVIGSGQALFQIAAAPFLTEHSSARERTHLFSTFFASALLAGVLGSAIGGAIPHFVRTLVPAAGLFAAYRVGLFAGAAVALGAIVPVAKLRRVKEEPLGKDQAPVTREQWRRLFPIALNSALIGMGAGLVIPFMNLYFKDRFGCSSGQIGGFFSIAQVCTAAAALLGPALARRFGKLRTAISSELLSLPFLVTLGAERHLPVAVGSFWIRATLMQAATPLLQTFVMEALPPALRARATSLINLVWNLGWATSAVAAGAVIERFGYATPFYMTAVLYFVAAATFWAAFRNVPETDSGTLPVEGPAGPGGDGPVAG